MSQILEGIHFGANRCCAYIGTHANTGKKILANCLCIAGGSLHVFFLMKTTSQSVLQDYKLNIAIFEFKNVRGPRLFLAC